MHWLFFVLAIGSVTHDQATATNSPGETVRLSEIGTEDRAVLSDVGSLRSLLESLLERIEKQDARIKQIEKTNVDDMRRKDVRINSLEREIDEMRKSYQLLIAEGKYHQYEVPDSDFKSTIPQEKENKNESVISSQKFRIQDEHQRPVRVPPNSPDEAIGAFSVYLYKDLDLHPGFVLKYDHVSLDRGGNYNMADGVYIVPVTGVYVFTWTSTSKTTTDVVTELVVDGFSRATLLSDGDNTHWDRTTELIVTPVSAGDHVFVRSRGSGNVYGTGYYGGSSFSGWRLS